MRIGSLCSGYGGLDMAVQMVVPSAAVAWHCEIDPHASRVLARRWPNVPNLGDIKVVDWGGGAAGGPGHGRVSVPALQPRRQAQGRGR